jgi:uncharacterized membrane protein YgcG
MSTIRLTQHLAARWFLQGPNLDAGRTLERMLASGMDIATILLASTLAVFLLLVFGVRALLIVRKRPVPLDPFDMAKPAAFRTLMVGAAAVLVPLAVLDFLPVEGLPVGWVLLWTYLFQFVLAVVLWLALEGFYRVRASRQKTGQQGTTGDSSAGPLDPGDGDQATAGDEP